MNLEDLKKKISGLETKNKKAAKLTWKPTDEHDVRLLPFGDEELGIEVFYHYNIGKNFKLYCPKNRGDECVICETMDKLRSWKDAKGQDKPESVRKAQFAASRNIEAGPKYYIPVIIRKKGPDGKTSLTEFEGPFYWEVSASTQTALLKICANDDYNDDHPDGGMLKILTSLAHGRDVTVTLKKPGEKGNTKSFALTEVIDRKKATQTLSSLETAKGLFAKLPPLEETLFIQSTAEVERAFAESFEEEQVAATDTPGVEHAPNNAEKLDGKAPVDDVINRIKGMIADKDKAAH